MIYTVTWAPDAEANLAQLWIDAADRQAVTGSGNRIDAELKTNPELKGIPFGDFRVYSDDPLAVMYSVDPGDMKVVIHAVKIIT